jgi:octaprenyl-diphosphate synthase
MSQVAKRADAARKQFYDLYAPVRAEMEQVDRLLREELRNADPFIGELVQHGFRIGGKRLRPALVLLTGKAVGRMCPDHLVMASVVEMIHTATLVHDDVLDAAEMRRHEDTINARYSNESSVLLGDFLFTHSFYLASTLETTYACRTIGRATNIVCEGELRQVHHRGDFDLTEDAYLQIIEAKTAELTSCCCRLGAHYAGATVDQESRLSNYGRHLGVAFQIIDDLLDMTGDETLTGKSLGTDLAQCKMTLPLIHILELASPEERAELHGLLNEPGENTRGALQPWLDRFDALGYARQKARRHATAAREQLAELEENPATEVLLNLTDFVLSRET